MPAFYLVEEIALILRLSTWAVYQAIKRGEIPGVAKIGGVIRISRAVFNRAMGIDDASGGTQ
jgi:excisionase family DNA binding protein